MPDLKPLVKRAMDKTLYCSLATARNGRAWVCPVAFAYDSSFNLYFVSSPKSRHMKNIALDGSVSVAIYSTGQPAKGAKVGIQLEGRAVRVRGDANIDKAYKVYFGRLPKWEDTDESYFKGKNPEWPFVKIKVTRLFYFNNGLFGEEKRRVL